MTPRGFDVDSEIDEEVREDARARAEAYRPRGDHTAPHEELPELPAGRGLDSEPRVPLERLSAAERASYSDGSWLRLTSEELIDRAGLTHARRDSGELAAAELAARVRIMLGKGPA